MRWRVARPANPILIRVLRDLPRKVLPLFDDIIEEKIEDWTLRLRIPQEPGKHPVLLLLHGWKGDEKVMWIFASKIPEHFLVISPRGIYPSPDGDGYGWATSTSEGYPPLEELKKSAESLKELLALQPGYTKGDIKQIHLMGFSQGAALSYTFAALYPEKVISVAGLSGFVPDGIERHIDSYKLADIKFFISHGTDDDIVPVERARAGLKILRQAGANVKYCEDEIGHKMSLDCLRNLGDFYNLESSTSSTSPSSGGSGR